MPELIEIVKENAEALERQGYVVTVHSALSWVRVSHPDWNEDLFFDGHVADDFVAERNRLYEELGDVTLEQVELHLAVEWIECVE